ncbi:MAG: helix-turn-helix transcriptional regulator [Candidatus Methanomethylicia archaeon]
MGLDDIISKFIANALTRVLILQTLSSGELLGGYHILKRITKTLNIRIKLSTFYTILKDMEMKGYINSISSDGKNRVYNITQKGKNALNLSKKYLKTKINDIISKTE